MSEAPPRADSGGAGTGGHGRVLAYTRRGEERRTRLETRVPLDWWCDDKGEVVFREKRSGKECRVTLAAPDDRCPRCGAAGPLELVGPGFHFTHACDPYKRAENAQRWAASDDDDTADFVASIFQRQIDRGLLASTGHPAYRRDKHEHAGLGVHPAEGKRGRLSAWWRRAIWRRLSSECEYVAGPGLQWGTQCGPAVGAGPVRPEAVPVGREVHGEPLERMGDGECLRAVNVPMIDFDTPTGDRLVEYRTVWP